MTVGIALTNGLEAVVMTDVRASGNGRQTDSAEKMAEINSENYCGVIFGSGRADYIVHILNSINRFTGESRPDDFLRQLYAHYTTEVRNDLDEHLTELKRDIQDKAKLIDIEKDREEYVRNSLKDIFARSDKMKEDAGRTSFRVALYDRAEQRIRFFGFGPFGHGESAFNHMMTGSGTDAADLYVEKKLQGVKTRSLGRTELTFFVANAYSESTINQGVGGTPKLAFVSNKGVEVVSDCKTIAIANLSAGYLADINPALNIKNVQKSIDLLFADQKGAFERIAKQLHIADPKAIKELYVPYSSWQERANRQRYTQ
jgi:hypothetical protein